MKQSLISITKTSCRKNMKYYEIFEGPAMFNDVPLMLAAYEMALSNKIKEDDPYES